MKRHYWQYLIDSSGNAVADARINVFLAGGSTYANIYTSEDGLPVTTEFTDIFSNSDGMFDFWIASKFDSLTYGYDSNQRFKITWSKIGMTTGSIDNIDIIFGSSGSGSSNNLFESNTINIPANSYTEFTLTPPLIRALIYYLKVEPSGLTDLYDIEFWNSDYTELLYQATNLSYGINWEDRFPFYLVDDLNSGNVYCKIRNTDLLNAGNFVIIMKYERFA